MNHTNQGSVIPRALHERAGLVNPRMGLFRILAALGFLGAGLVGGTITLAWRPDWAWPFPVAGFIGYVLVFRRGMLLWNPNIDRTWRQSFWLDRDTAPENGQPANGMDDPFFGATNLRAVRLIEASHPSRPGQEAVR